MAQDANIPDAELGDDVRGVVVGIVIDNDDLLGGKDER
jgi:hypothetical protein